MIEVSVTWKQIVLAFAVSTALVAISTVSNVIFISLSVDTLQDVGRMAMALSFIIAAVVSFFFPFKSLLLKVPLVFVAIANAGMVLNLALSSGSESLRSHVIVGVTVWVFIASIAMFRVGVELEFSSNDSPMGDDEK